MNPLLLYSPDGTRSRRVYHVDAPGWLAAGWSTVPVMISVKEPDAIKETKRIETEELDAIPVAEKTDASLKVVDSIPPQSENILDPTLVQLESRKTRTK